MPEPEGIYHPHADLYVRAGWTNPFPVQGKAIGVPPGVTGREGRALTRAEVAAWMSEHPDRNIALRLDGVIGIDVDNYSKGGIEKRGWITLQLAEARWGKLPPTWRSSARAGASGIRFYRVPPGYLGLATQLKLADENGELWGDIEIIQYHHRFALVWPSLHPDLKVPYRWYDLGDHVVINLVPTVEDDIPWLPEPWLLGLLELGTQHDPELARDPVQAEPREAAREAWHPTVERHYTELLDAIGSPVGSRHDNTLPRVGALARDEGDGLAGATTAMRMGFSAYVARVQDREAENDFLRMVLSSRGMVAGTVSKRQMAKAAWDEFLAPIPWAHEADAVHTAQSTGPVDVGDSWEGFGVWAPADIAAYFDPSWEPDPPDLFARADGRCLWCRGNLNWLHGPSGSGKTWVALMTVAQELAAGRHVTWVHYEDPLPDKLAYRLRLLGVTVEQAVEFFHVLVVNGESLAKGMAMLRAVNARYGPELVVIDSVGEALGADGIPVKDDEKMVPWMHATLRTLAADGPAVLCVDHTPMSEPDRLEPIGTQRKKSGTTGAMYLCSTGAEFTRTKAGYLKLTCAKDRTGFWTAGDVVAIVKVHPKGDRIDWEVTAPDAEAEGEPVGPQEAITVVVARHAYRAIAREDRPMSRRALEAALVGIKARATVKREGIELAIVFGWIKEVDAKGGRKLLVKGNEPEGPNELLARL